MAEDLNIGVDPALAGLLEDEDDTNGDEVVPLLHAMPEPAEEPVGSPPSPPSPSSRPSSGGLASQRDELVKQRNKLQRELEGVVRSSSENDARARRELAEVEAVIAEADSRSAAVMAVFTGEAAPAAPPAAVAAVETPPIETPAPAPMAAAAAAPVAEAQAAERQSATAPTPLASPPVDAPNNRGFLHRLGLRTMALAVGAVTALGLFFAGYGVAQGFGVDLFNGNSWERAFALAMSILLAISVFMIVMEALWRSQTRRWAR